jgi:methyl-accepting chemotaxis protein
VAILSDPWFWLSGALLGVVLGLGVALLRARADRRESLEQTAAELAAAAHGLLGNVDAVTATASQAVDRVRATTETMTHLSHIAMTAAVSAETVIGLAQQSERAADAAIAGADARGAELLRLADDVRGMAGGVERLHARMRDLFETSAVVGWVAERSHELAESAGAEAARAGDGEGFRKVADELRRHADDAKRAAAQVKAVLAEVSREMQAAVAAAGAGVARAEAGAESVRSAGKTVKSLAEALRDSAGAARHIATLAQQQETKLDEVLQAMNAIYLATEQSLAANEGVADEARSLDALASALRRAVTPPGA